MVTDTPASAMAWSPSTDEVVASVSVIRRLASFDSTLLLLAVAAQTTASNRQVRIYPPPTVRCSVERALQVESRRENAAGQHVAQDRRPHPTRCAGHRAVQLSTSVETMNKE